MEKLNSLLKFIIIGLSFIILIIIISSYKNAACFILMPLLFVLLYTLNKQCGINSSAQKDSSKKINIILAILLFVIALVIRLVLVKLLDISPESDFALLINASSQLAKRK